MTSKKSFKRSEPTLAFLSGAEEKTSRPPKKDAPRASSSRSKPTTKDRETAPEGYKLAPQYIEKKTRRVQLLIQPSLYEDVKKKASSLGISTNEAISEALKAYTEA
jgi:predicted DNA binding CopG/RHH family protein